MFGASLKEARLITSRIRFAILNRMAAPSSESIPAPAQMFALLNGVYVAGAVACLAELGIPDLVEAGARSAADLARQLRLQSQPLYRLMRATASVGVLSEGTDGRFSQTPLSAVLRSDADPSLRAFAMMSGREWHALGWSHLADCVRTGRQALDIVQGTQIFDFLEKTPEEAAIFNAAMSSLSAVQAPAVAAAYSFAGIKTIVDIAGGLGLLLATVLRAHPEIRGTLYDLPRVIDRAKTGPLESVLNRCDFASGDMFVSVPQGADAYMMKHIIHDWPDEDCVKLLKACRKAVNPGGRLLVIDNVIRPGNDFAPGKFLDLQMLIFPGGRERTEQEFRQLFDAAGWRLTRVIPTAVPESIVEAVPSEAV